MSLGMIVTWFLKIIGFFTRRGSSRIKLDVMIEKPIAEERKRFDKLRSKIKEIKVKINRHDIIVLAAVIAGIIIMLYSIAGCVRPVYMDHEHVVEFTQFAAAVADWDRRCAADPNTCAESLHSMAEEVKYWQAIVTGIDPNTVR